MPALDQACPGLGVNTTWSGADDLRDEALRMIEGITAAKAHWASPCSRSLPLLAEVSEHDTMVVALGTVAGITENADRICATPSANMSDTLSPSNWWRRPIRGCDDAQIGSCPGLNTSAWRGPKIAKRNCCNRV